MKARCLRHKVAPRALGTVGRHRYPQLLRCLSWQLAPLDEVQQLVEAAELFVRSGVLRVVAGQGRVPLCAARPVEQLVRVRVRARARLRLRGRVTGRVRVRVRVSGGGERLEWRQLPAGSGAGGLAPPCSPCTASQAAPG